MPRTAPTPPTTGPARAPASPPGLAEVAARLHLDVLVYADRPEDRLVFINAQKYVEGQRLDDRVLVEAITPEGAVLALGGERVLLRPRLNPYLAPPR